MPLPEAAPDDGADLADDIARSREKAARAPVLLLAVLRSEPADDEVPLVERAITLGAALVNLLLAAHGLGHGAMLTSGRAVRAASCLSMRGQRVQVLVHNGAVCCASTQVRGRGD